MSNHLTVVAYIIAKPGMEDATRHALMALIEPTQQEDGCILYHLHEHTDKPGTFVFYESWKSKEALDQHLATPYLKALMARVPELLAEPPQILTLTRIA